MLFFKKLKNLTKFSWFLPASLLLSSCDNQDDKKQFFLKSMPLKSGDYYLVIDQEYSNIPRTLFDDPKILHQYKDQIYIKKNKVKSFMFGEGGGGGIALYKRGTLHPIASNPRTYDWHIPQEMWQFGKVLGEQESYQNKHNFLQRLTNLNKIEGALVNFKTPFQGNAKAWNLADLNLVNDDNKKAVHFLHNDHFISIYAQDSSPKKEDQIIVSVLLPLVITHVTQNYDAHFELANLQQTLAQEMERNGISDYFAYGSIYNSSWAFYGLLRDQRQKVGLQLHDDYRNQQNNTLKLKEYEAYTFGLRIICAQDCLAQIEKMQILNWLQSPVSKEELIAATKK